MILQIFTLKMQAQIQMSFHGHEWPRLLLLHSFHIWSQYMWPVSSHIFITLLVKRETSFPATVFKYDGGTWRFPQSAYPLLCIFNGLIISF